ncbi:MarR family winged helix-turn-helix transcriptional regulator [Halalkalibacter krulwichiae]|uniref:Transcriptional regulator SlyA n=1 Tax=Halalkalibacter krulwichiae TaxID=199441 RepID=A0A1X9MBU3_9BACI|nr:MarR family transcriptional regulator [Halalkalibacter krulwichiae]ARK29623.1 Transcriptional regulator SlyA [Halalkalibacter krulwichiae]
MTLLYGHVTNQLARKFKKKWDEQLSPTGLFSSQWAILYFLFKKGKVTQIEISKYLNVEAPTITRTLNRLEEDGWINRESGKDRRERFVCLTDKAREHYPELLKLAQEIENETIAGISEQELYIFRRVVEQMHENLDRL